MSDNSDDVNVSQATKKAKRKPRVLSESDSDSDDSLVPRRNGKRNNATVDSNTDNTDSSIEKPRKLKRKRASRITSDSELSSNSSTLLPRRKRSRVISDNSASSSSDVGFDYSSSDEYQSDWISEVEEAPEFSETVAFNNAATSDSSDADAEKCPICLLAFREQEVGTPETCDHSFCADCIQEWSRNVNTCPVDRQTFTLILVRRCYNGKVVRQIPVEVRRPSVDELIQEDPTYCEVCGMSDREDRLLLCDGCDLGYHLECLDPPLDMVPIEEWYCSDCRANDHTSHSRRLIPRTSQNERIRAAIETGLRQSAHNANDQNSISSGFEDASIPGTSGEPVRMRNHNAPVHKRKRRSKKKSRKSKKPLVYHTCDANGQRITIRRRRKRRSRRKRRRNQQLAKPKTVKKRLAVQLGMCPPNKPGLMIPELKNRTHSSTIGFQRNEAGIPALHLFGQRDELDYFSDSASDVDVALVGGAVGVLAQARTATSERRAARRKGILMPEITNVSSCDILGSILDSQAKFHSKRSVISVNCDGSIHIEDKTSDTKNNLIKSTNDLERISADTSAIDITDSANVEATQTPMFPGRGGGNRPPYGFQRGGGGGGNTYGRYDGGSNYTYFQGQGGPRGRGYGTNMYNNYNNYGPGNSYGNFFHNQGPPTFRGRGMTRFPPRRPPMPLMSQPPPAPVELMLDEAQAQPSVNEDNVDIYSDIEGAATSTVEDDSPLKPPPLPPPLVAQALNATDSDSDTELIIDDSVKDPEKYDPSDPFADTDSNPELPSQIEQEELQAEQEEAEMIVTETKVVQVVQPRPENKLSNFPAQIVTQVVKHVMEHFSTSPKPGPENKIEEEFSDEECPNFSIYSAESIDIAKSTDTSFNIPQDEMAAEEQVEPHVETKVNEEQVAMTTLEDSEETSDEAEIEPDVSDDEDVEEPVVPDDKGVEEKPVVPNDRVEEEEPITSVEKDVDEESVVPDEKRIEEFIFSNKLAEESILSDKNVEEPIVSVPEDKVNDDSISISANTEIESTTPPLPHIEKIKIAFDPFRKTESVKKGMLQLYDDSDWEEWGESKLPVVGQTDLDGAELDKITTESISEEERSYTPCLDEKEPIRFQSDEERNIAPGIGGMDTELISEDERNEFDESHDMKTVSDGDALEINAKESELDLARPEDYEEGEIVEKSGAKKVQQQTQEKVKEVGTDEEKKKRAKKKTESDKDKNKENEKTKKPEFKKLSKSNKERNYRDKDKVRSKSKDRKGKENKEGKREKKKEKKKDLERYNVRSLIADKPRKDQFGRDIHRSESRSSASSRRSLSRRRSLSWDKSKKRRRRSRSRSRSFSRSPRRSRSVRRSRSRSLRYSKSPRNKKHRLHRSPSREHYRSRRKSPEKQRSKKKKRSVSKLRSPSLKRHQREWEHRQSYTREWTPSWSRSPTPRPVPHHSLPQSLSPSWTPPLMDKGPGVQPENLTVILNNDVSKKKKDRKKKSDKKSRDEYRKRKRIDRTPPPSKEVFASGDNILVSVSFNKTANDDVGREVVGAKRKRDVTTDTTSKKPKKDKTNKEKKKRAKSPKTKRRNKEIANMKPVAIIDLDRSPFKELTPSPKDVIVLSDSDNCDKEAAALAQRSAQNELALNQRQGEDDSGLQSPIEYSNTTGPKTPPEPQVKFLLTTKQTQLRAITNPLHDPNDDIDPEIDPQEELEHRLEDVLHKGPNTPPEPPTSPPSSPDAYDPFDPTKSRSPTPEPQIQAVATPEKTESDGDLVDLAVGPLESSQKPVDSAEKLASPERPKSPEPPETAQEPENKTEGDKSKSPLVPERNAIGVVINQQVQPVVVKPIIPTAVYSTVTASVITTTSTSLQRTAVFTTPVPQRIILPTPSKSSPAKSSPSKPPIKSTPIKPMPSKTMISKLPVPNVKPLTPIRKPQTKPVNRTIGQNGNEVIDVDIDFESPYSPGSSDYEDLFEPPAESIKNNSRNQLLQQQQQQKTKSPAKQNIFDSLFGSSPVYRSQNNKTKGKTNAAKVPMKMNKKSTPTKAATNKTQVGVKIDEDHLKILDDLPNSAVEMQVKDKFLKKLNRQERVVEEVKLVLKPHYNKKHITKEQYKDILRRAVPKICHNRSGEINPKKIQNLIEAYVRKARHIKKSLGVNVASAVGPGPMQQKSAKTSLWS